MHGTGKKPARFQTVFWFFFFARIRDRSVRGHWSGLHHACLITLGTCIRCSGGRAQAHACARAFWPRFRSHHPIDSCGADERPAAGRAGRGTAVACMRTPYGIHHVHEAHASARALSNCFLVFSHPIRIKAVDELWPGPPRGLGRAAGATPPRGSRSRRALQPARMHAIRG